MRVKGENHKPEVYKHGKGLRSGQTSLSLSFFINKVEIIVLTSRDVVGLINYVYTVSGSMRFQYTSFPIPLVPGLSVPKQLACYRCRELKELVPLPRRNC